MTDQEIASVRGHDGAAATPAIHGQLLAEDPAIDRYIHGWGTQSGDYGVIAQLDGAPRGAAWLRYFTADSPGYGFVNEGRCK
jgi:hypothetical protein